MYKNKHRHTFLHITYISIFLCLVSQYAHAQNIPDTLTLAKQARDNKKIKYAYTLLSVYQKDHTTDFNTCWLFAQTAYWMKDFTTAETYYDKALAMKPNMYLLQVDYARTLIGITHYDKAQALLVNYVQDTSRYYNVSRILLAQILFIKGDYKKAVAELNKVLQNDPSNAEANALLYDVHTVLSPYVKAGVEYYSDNQPLKTITPSVDAGIYVNTLLAPDINITTPLFVNGTIHAAEWFQLGNQSLFRKQHIVLNLHAGAIKLQNENKTSWTANVSIDKTVLHHLILSAQAAHQPYLYTLGAVDSNTMYYKYVASATWDNTKSWNGNATYQLSHVAGNTITSISAWGLTPPLKVSIVELRVGAAYSYSNALHDDYSSDKSLAAIIAGYQYNTAVTGVFTPLYTPNHQYVYAGVASAIAHPIKKLTLRANINAGYANIEVPYLYLNTNSADKVFIDRSYTKEYYKPITISAYAGMQVSRRLSVYADYVYSNTYYFTSNLAGVGFKMILGNEKR